jgi:hypothetical protein
MRRKRTPHSELKSQTLKVRNLKATSQTMMMNTLTAMKIARTKSCLRKEWTGTTWRNRLKRKIGEHLPGDRTRVSPRLRRGQETVARADDWIY